MDQTISLIKQRKQTEWSEQWKMFDEENRFLFEDWIQPLKLEDTNARDNAIVKAVETVFTAMAVAVNQRNPTLMSGYNTTLFAQSATDLLAQANLISHSLSKIGSDDLIIYHTILCGLTLLLGPGKDAVLTILSSPQIVRAVSQTDEFKAVKQQLLVSCSKYLATKGAKKLFKDFVKSKSPTNPVEMFQNLETSIKNYFFGCKKRTSGSSDRKFRCL